MYLLPKEHLATKKIMESSPTVNCDIYTEHASDTTKQLTDDFIRFIEAHLNKIKKMHCQRSTRVSTICFDSYIFFFLYDKLKCPTHKINFVIMNFATFDQNRFSL